MKYYRHIRNQIAHEVDATEEMICSLEDTIWIEEFYQRILQQTDPLAMYYKASTVQQSMRPVKAPSFYVVPKSSNATLTLGVKRRKGNLSMKAKTCMLGSGIANVVHALLLLAVIPVLLGYGQSLDMIIDQSLGQISSVDGLHGFVGATLLIGFIRLLFGLATTIVAAVLAFMSRGKGKSHIVACTVCCSVSIFFGNFWIGLIATVFAAAGMYLVMREPKDCGS